MALARFLILLAMGGLICMAVAGADKEQSKPAAEARPKPRAAKELKSNATAKAETAESAQVVEAAVKESANRFVANYNKHDFKAAAADFMPSAEFVTENGTVIRGREAIARHFAAVFTDLPQAHLEIQVESVQLVTSAVALEEGRVDFNASPQSPVETSRYVALHVFQDGRWWLARTRDFSADAAARSNHDRLGELDWLIGEWMEEGEDSLIATSCQWSDNRNYLLQEFTIRVGGEPAVTGSTRIGWDPLTRQIKSWTFDSDGGYSEALWTRGTDQWVLKSRGVTHRGRSYSGTSILRRIDQRTLSWESRDRVEGGVLVADQGPFVVKRKPPSAAD
ncbi:MAG TPA: SgcJ/EcaC family oxidoreductase [Planctomycetaceae bacterium]